MPLLEYVKPLEFSTGQILGRANLGVLRDNDDYFNALADRRIPVPAGQVTEWHGGTSRVAWDGWHLKRTDMDTLYYYAEIDSVDHVAEPTTLVGWYDYNDDHDDTQMFSIVGDATASDTVDLSGFPNGLYRVTFLMTRTAGWDNATASIMAPYTIYTGALSYAAGTDITDGNVSAAADFNKWRSNDIYFNAITPSQLPAVGMTRETTYASNDLELLNGWDKWHPDHARLSWRVYMHEFDTDVIKVYYDADDVDGIQSHDLATGSGWTESVLDLADNGYTKGDWYRVRVVLEPSANAGWRFGHCDYIYITAAALDGSYTVMDALAVDQFVYGSTAAQLSRLDYLSDNDASIYDRLSWGAAIPGRMDFACFEPVFAGFNGGLWYGNYRFTRIGDTLYYRTLGAELVKPDGSTESLEDHDGSSGDYNVLDLNTIDLPHGSSYVIRRVSYTTVGSLGQAGGTGTRITDEVLEFAMEI